MTEHLISISDIEECDLEDIAEIHLTSFSDRPLSLLGQEAVMRYYRCILSTQRESIYRKAVVNSETVGFCIGGHFTGSVLKTYLRGNFFFLLKQFFLRLAQLSKNPYFTGRVKLALRVLLVGRSGSAHQESQPLFRILALAVSPRAQRLGVGRKLSADMEEFAIRSGQALIGLSVNPENIGAVAFYEKTGWQKNPPSNEWSGYMIKRLDPEEPTPSSLPS